MKTYSIPMFLPTGSGVTGLRHQSQLRRCLDLNQSGTQSSELPHLPTFNLGPLYHANIIGAAFLLCLWAKKKLVHLT
jgi:hypothetical protein